MLLPARRIHQAAGFRLVGSEAYHPFGMDLAGEGWELALRSGRER